MTNDFVEKPDVAPDVADMALVEQVEVVEQVEAVPPAPEAAVVESLVVEPVVAQAAVQQPVAPAPVAPAPVVPAAAMPTAAPVMMAPVVVAMKPTVDAKGNPISDKSRAAAAILCFFLGALGIHRFYVGKVGTGILMLITLGALGVWVLIDFIWILVGTFRDKQGKMLVNW